MRLDYLFKKDDPAKDYLDDFGDSAAESDHEQVCATTYVHRFEDHLLFPATPLAQTGSILYYSE